MNSFPVFGIQEEGSFVSFSYLTAGRWDFSLIMMRKNIFLSLFLLFLSLSFLAGESAKTHDSRQFQGWKKSQQEAVQLRPKRGKSQPPLSPLNLREEALPVLNENHPDILFLKQFLLFNYTEHQIDLDYLSRSLPTGPDPYQNPGLYFNPDQPFLQLKGGDEMARPTREWVPLIKECFGSDPASEYYRKISRKMNRGFTQLNYDRCESDSDILYARYYAYPIYSYPFPPTWTQEERDKLMGDADKYSLIKYPRASDCPDFICKGITNLSSSNYQLYHDALRTSAEIIILKTGELTQDKPSANFGPQACGWTYSYHWLKTTLPPGKEHGNKILLARAPYQHMFQHGHDQWMRNFVQFADFFIEHPEFRLASFSFRKFNWKYSNLFFRMSNVLKNLLGLVKLMKSGPSSSSLAPEDRFIGDTPGLSGQMGAFCHANDHPLIYWLLRALLSAHLPPVPIHLTRKNKIVYFPRLRNRKIENEKLLLRTIREEFGSPKSGYDALELVKVNSGMKQTEIDHLLKEKTVAVLSSHGGAFYNAFVCPPGTVIVEFVPFPFLRNTNSFFEFFTGLGMKHWSMVLDTPMNVELSSLVNILTLELRPKLATNFPEPVKNSDGMERMGASSQYRATDPIDQAHYGYAIPSERIPKDRVSKKKKELNGGHVSSIQRGSSVPQFVDFF